MKLKIFIFLFFICANLYSSMEHEEFLRANSLYQQKKYREALKSYELIKKKGPATWYNMGNCYFRIEDYSHAIVCWRRAQKYVSCKKFDQIEQRIGRLVEASKSLEATNEELRKKIETLEKELQGKTETEKGYLEERDLIRSKIDNLLVRLEEITETSS